MQRDGIGVEDDIDDLEAATARAGHVDGENPSEQASQQGSRHSRGIENVLGVRRQRLAGEVEQRQLHRRGCRRLGGGYDEWPDVVAVGEAAGVFDQVDVGRGDEGAQLGEEVVGRHDDEAALAREVETDPAVGEQVDGVEGKRGSQQVLADAFEALPVTTVYRGGGVQIHTVGEGDEVWCVDEGGGGSGRGQGELNAGGEGGVDIGLVGQSGVSEVGRDSIENADDVALVQVGQGMEDDVAVGLLLEGAVGGQDVEVDKQTQVGSEPLDDGDDARVQPANRTQPVLLLGEATQPWNPSSNECGHSASRFEPRLQIPSSVLRSSA